MRNLLKSRVLATLLTTTCVAALGSSAHANPIPLTATNEAYTQDFDTLANTGTPNTTSPMPAGWLFLELGSSGNATYSAGTGSSTTGDTYSLGASGSTERALGGLASNNLQTVFGTRFVNETNEVIHSLSVSFFTEMWRRGQTGTAPDRAEFRYRKGGENLQLTDGTWTDVVVGMNLVTPRFPEPIGTQGTAFDGNAADNRAQVRHVLTNLALAPGEVIWLRWQDVNVTGVDDALAIDDFSLTPNPTPAAPIDFAKEVRVLGGGSATTGSVVEYDVYFENTSDADFASLVFADRLPDGLVPIADGFEVDIDGVVVSLTAEADGDIGTIAGQNVTVAVNNLAAGEAVLVTFRARVGTVTAAGTFNANTLATWQVGTGAAARGFTAFASASFPTIVTGVLQFNIFFDTNNNGTRDEGEEGLAGWDVLATGTAVVTTDADGLANLGRLPVGTVDILVEAAEADGAWNFVAPETATLTANQTTTVTIAVTCTCNDNSVCTQSDRCDKGLCFFENPLDCGISNDPCVVNICDDTLGCTEIFTTAACNDGLLSTRNDTCNGAGTCVGSPYICEVGECQASSTPNGSGCDVVLEDPGTTCSDNLNTTRNDVCNAEGECVGEPYSCPPSDNPCVAVVQDGSGCGFAPINPGGNCDDNNTSTRNDVCNAEGACAGETYECPVSTNPCIANVTNGTDCTATPTNLGGTCSDGLNTTRNDVCNANGACVGETYECPPSDNPCVAVVQDGSGCGFEPVNPGGSCDDNNTSTRNDVCNAEGNCAGETYECPVSTNPCIANVTNGTDCTATPTNLGGTCSDGSDATGNDVCTSNGTCVGTPIVCEPSNNPCQINAPNGTACELRPTNLGGTCDDGLTTTRNDACNANGACAGETYECPASTNPCITNVPNGTDCTATPTNVGGTCNDGSDATGNDVCTSNGTCVGTPIVCEPANNPCQVNVPNGTTCELRPANLGGTCDDGLTTTRNDACNANGACAGQTYECPVSTNPCITNVPNGIDCTATPTNVGGTCNDGSDATGNDVCTSNGTCAGTPIVCEPANNPCQVNVPNGTTCELRPTNLGGTCDDGLTTTRNDACNANGACAGETYECPASTNPCITNVPNGTDCTTTPTNVGGTCDDNSDATGNDVCTNEGTCVGTPIVCEPAQCEETSVPNGTDCTVTFKPATAACDDDNDNTRNDACNGVGDCAGETYACEPAQCEATSVPNGIDCTVTFKSDTESCDDGNACTTNDLCNGSGACGGTPVTCDVGEVCGNEGACEATHCDTCVDDAGCGDESACVAVGESGTLRCLVACETDEDCGEDQVCADHATAGKRCFDADGDCAAPTEEPNPDVDPVEPGPEAQPEEVEPGPEATPDAPVETETITSGGGGCASGNGTAGAWLLLALVAVLFARRRQRA